MSLSLSIYTPSNKKVTGMRVSGITPLCIIFSAESDKNIYFYSDGEIRYLSKKTLLYPPKGITKLEELPHSLNLVEEKSSNFVYSNNFCVFYRVEENNFEFSIYSFEVGSIVRKGIIILSDYNLDCYIPEVISFDDRFLYIKNTKIFDGEKCDQDSIELYIFDYLLDVVHPLKKELLSFFECLYFSKDIIITLHSTRKLLRIYVCGCLTFEVKIEGEVNSIFRQQNLIILETNRLFIFDTDKEEFTSFVPMKISEDTYSKVLSIDFDNSSIVLQSHNGRATSIRVITFENRLKSEVEIQKEVDAFRVVGKFLFLSTDGITSIYQLF